MGRGVKNFEKLSDVICGSPLNEANQDGFCFAMFFTLQYCLLYLLYFKFRRQLSLKSQYPHTLLFTVI